jgi:SecD/SecF fusion protein
MSKNLFWKCVLIVFLIVIAMWELYPPQQTLKGGLDLVGGTSIVYDIDTRGLDSHAKKGLAEKTIKVLRRRIDPANMMNLEWLAQGNDRIEIKMPLASSEVIQKRKTYTQALDALEQGNINLAIIRRSLDKDPQQRDADFAKYSLGVETRLNILQELAAIYDQRNALTLQRDSLVKDIIASATLLKTLGMDVKNIETVVTQWVEKDPGSLNVAIAEFLSIDPNQVQDANPKVKALTGYITAYKTWADVVNQLTNETSGLNIKYTAALNKLEDLNLTVSQISDVLEIDPSSVERQDMLNEMIAKHPDRKDKIEATVAAYDAYRPFRGRLDGSEDLKRMLRGAGVLDFRIIPVVGDEGFTQTTAMTYIDNLKQKGPQAASDSRYIWLEVEDIQGWRVAGSATVQFGKKSYVLASNKAEERMLASEEGKEWKLRYARSTSDNLGRPAVGFAFNTVGSNMFYRLTGNNIDRPLAIILDGIALSAPNIKSAIGDRGGIIEGKFTLIEVQDMVSKLDAGSLKARLIEPPVSEKTIGPGIGADNRQKGIYAIYISFIVVAVFMSIYYIGSGAIAVFALVLNILFILAIMAFSSATFTMSGIAGIILTIGMSVDANVLINERIREELQKGASVRIAIDSGYERAFSAIFDSNVTTFIIGAILYYVASEDVKGFAVTLMIGIVSSMFTALFVTRTIFRLLTDTKIIRKRLPMFSVVKSPKIPWVQISPFFTVISIICILGGLFIFFTRDDQKNSKYDIEFTGGTSVTIMLKDDVSMTRDQVENLIRSEGEKVNNPLIQRAKVYSVGDAGNEYEISTIETNKASAMITFNDPNVRTAEQVKDAIVVAYNNIGRELENIAVTANAGNPSSFVVSTSQVNTSLIAEVLTAAFGNTATFTEPKVDEVVSNAIKDAFAGKLKVLSNLDPNIISTSKIDSEIVNAYPEISQFLGGIKIECQLASPVKISEIKQRFDSLRFKPDLIKLTKNPYKLLTTDYTDVEKATSDTLTDKFIFVAVSNQAAGAELTGTDWDNFENIEKSRVLEAGHLETSLSRVNQIAPSVGKQAKTQALIAIILSLIAIIIYVWVRFGNLRYGFASTIALVHDVCITLGAVVACTYIAGTPLGNALGIQDFKINLEIIAAFLTIIGYSINDTIVIFDRIRENRGKLDFVSKDLINDSINQTLSRTLLTSFTVFLVLLVMYVYGGAGLRGFTFAMLVGTVAGVYSTVVIAAPILLIGQKKQQSK